VRKVLIGAAVALPLVAVLAGSAVALTKRSSSLGPPNVVLVTNGSVVSNTQSPPNTPAFAAWCGGTCSPSTMEPVVDAATGQVRGNFYTWTKNLTSFSACFGEFVWFALNDGDVYVNSGDDGTCGGPISKAPSHGGDLVIAGGGDGAVVGGTGKYSNWAGGTYTDRLFAEISFSGGGYYDQLFWSISKS